MDTIKFIKAALGTLIIYCVSTLSIPLFLLLMETNIPSIWIAYLIGLYGIGANVLIFIVSKTLGYLTNEDMAQIQEIVDAIKKIPQDLPTDQGSVIDIDLANIPKSTQEVQTDKEADQIPQNNQ